MVTPPPYHRLGEYISYQAFCESHRKERHMYQAWYCHGCGTRSLPLLPPSVEIHYQGNSSQRIECAMELEYLDTLCWCVEVQRQGPQT